MLIYVRVNCALKFKFTQVLSKKYCDAECRLYNELLDLLGGAFKNRYY